MNRSYFELRMPFEGQALEMAMLMVETAAADDEYVLFEREQEVMLGIAPYATLTVHSERTLLTTPEDEKAFSNEDLSNTIAEAMAAIEVEDWQAYGIANFELARYLHGLPVTNDEQPLVQMFVPMMEVRFQPGSVLLRALDDEALSRLRDSWDANLIGEDDRIAELRARQSANLLALTDEQDKTASEYAAMVATALGDISAQRYRKVVISRQLELPQQIDLAASFLKARAANTPARSFALSVGDLKTVGLSPETVAEVEGRMVYTTPLAGTRAVLDDTLETLRLREELVSDSKEIAEHAISVYLSFDEMTMVCDPESVCVTQFMLVALRGSVQHLASRLKGKLLDGCNPWHAFCALFPAVTASGVPKREAIEAIGTLEPVSRGLYSGSVFVADSNGRLDSALVLRSLFQTDEQTWLQAGAGIMNMSIPEREVEETREKFRSFSNYLVMSDEPDKGS